MYEEILSTEAHSIHFPFSAEGVEKEVGSNWHGNPARIASEASSLVCFHHGAEVAVGSRTIKSLCFSGHDSYFH